MGNYFQLDTTWYVYRRTLSTDEWVCDPLQSWPGISLELALSRFKHEAYSLSLSKHVEYADTKAIYLYSGSTRVAKASKEPESEQLEVWSTSIREWVASNEILGPQRYPLHEKEFFSKYVHKYAWINTQTVTFVRK